MATQSQAAREIEIYLKRHAITYRTEVRYPECKDKRQLPFDFEIIVNGRVGLIEFDGAQHFKLTSKFHGTDTSKLTLQQSHDVIKTRFAKNTNKSLLRIAYTETDTLYVELDKYVLAMKSSSNPIYMFSNDKLYHQHLQIIYPPPPPKASSCTIL